jgi:hypothetical protein
MDHDPHPEHDDDGAADLDTLVSVGFWLTFAVALVLASAVIWAIAAALAASAGLDPDAALAALNAQAF